MFMTRVRLGLGFVLGLVFDGYESASTTTVVTAILQDFPVKTK